jgi:hypothetical protein
MNKIRTSSQDSQITKLMEVNLDIQSLSESAIPCLEYEW